MKFTDNLDNINLKEKQVIGIDETGVGDYFTPLISVAAFLPQELEQWAIDLGVKDSKKLSEKQILFIAPKLIGKISYGSYKLTQKGYNSLSKNYNANELKFFSHIKALNTLLERDNQANLVIIDKYSTTNAILKYYKNILVENNWAKIQDPNIDIILLEKAESISLSVACASIIARYLLIKHMQEQNKQWNFIFPLGANSAVQDKVLEFEQLHGKTALNEVCKTTFKIRKHTN
ncbi:ribonuclease HIII [Mycoplasma hafezii]|uniref:ribonuclease HIII n=1 Tax=Mycoplasma hafezii TaxID=525886 RepID=UPI003CEF73FF